MDTSAWFDQWASISPLINYVTYRDINRGGMRMDSKVADIISEGVWRWPTAWNEKYNVLSNLPVPFLNNQVDTLQWRMVDGKDTQFFVKDAWNSIRERGDEVSWHKLVWSRYGIPRHAIHMWLVIRNILKTQDRLKQWDVGDKVDLNQLSCPLCKLQKDSHSHLFFECVYADRVWKLVLNVADLPNISSNRNTIMAWLIPITNRDTVNAIVGRLIVAATLYYVWQERNNRVYGKNTRSHEDLASIIVDTVRLKLASIKFKKKTHVEKLRRTWKLHEI